ncbi:Acyl transferase/acyl hydrolase/lysophospholipase [Apiospora phragmitis]|uniref:Acyl transferase/acyl hydrolase/lysophospholipase n=1 Tax=Apiospora phragmitis TaxID=2905665 RepID=A0ABR1UHT1_9PEZI
MEVHSDLNTNDTPGEKLVGSSSAETDAYGTTTRAPAPSSWCYCETKGGCYSPIAIVGMACRLPGHCSSPNDLWDFLMRGGVADTEPPATRFKLEGHFDGSRKPYTMKTPGAIDPEDRNESPTVGSGRALLSNRISHFLNVHGPSAAVDTACSSALTALDMACVYLRSHQVDAMLVGGANISDFFDDGDNNAMSRSPGEYVKPKLLVISANDETALKGSIKALSSHLLHPGVDLSLEDLVYTLSQRRSRLYHRAYSLQNDTRIRTDSFTSRKNTGQEARIGFVFTGQGAEWPMMGKDLLTAFPVARATVETLDRVLAGLSNPPAWSLTSLLMDDRSAAVTGSDTVQIACFNSPSSLTLSGTVQSLKEVMAAVQRDGHFARMLKVDMAYHSTYMSKTATEYARLLDNNPVGLSHQRSGVSIFSSVTGKEWHGIPDALYWVNNMTSPVRFRQAVGSMVQEKHRPNFFVEIGPSNTLAGPVAQIFDAECHLTTSPTYSSVAKRGPEPLNALYSMAGKLFTAGASIDLYKVNELQDKSPSFIVDLPNYQWNHSTKHWHESLASKDWRFRPFVRHDLLGTKLLGTPWENPIWQNRLRIENNGWLRDHKLGNSIVFPGAAYVCTAMAGVYQATYMTTWKGDPPKAYMYQLRKIKFLKTLVLDPSSTPPLLNLSLKVCRGLESSWYEFKVSVMSKDTWSDHASGLIRIDTKSEPSKAPEHTFDPFEHPYSQSAWYKKISGYGINFGPAFRSILSMDYTMGLRKGRARISLTPPASDWAQSNYPLHPASMDGCFQSVISSMWEGDLSNINVALVPLEIDSLIVHSGLQSPTNEAWSNATAEYVGIGRRDLVQNYSPSCSAYDPSNGHMVLGMKSMRCAAFNNNGNTSPPHTYCHLAWDNDITMASKADIDQFVKETLVDTSANDMVQAPLTAQRLIDLVSFKNPRLAVLEINLDPTSFSPVWLQKPNCDHPLRRGFSQYTYVTSNSQNLFEVQRMNTGLRNAEFRFLDIEHTSDTTTSRFYLAIVQLPATLVEGLSPILQRVGNSLHDDQFVLLLNFGRIEEFNDSELVPPKFNILWRSGMVALARKITTKQSSPISRDLLAVHFNTNLAHEVQIIVQDYLSPDIMDVPRGSKVVVVDELRSQIMSTLDHHQWALLQTLVAKECDILWVTSGAQLSVTEPNRALVNGLFRTVRNETPFLRIINLDTERATGATTIHAILRCLDLLDKTGNSDYPQDYEFVERHGRLHISRVLPDTLLNAARDEESAGKPTCMTVIADAKSTIRLQAERVGNLDSLQYSEVTDGPAPLPPGFVEIDVLASGVNFKDVATVIGLVPENEYVLGAEGSGVIMRIAPDVTSFKPGERVAFFRKGSFGNRVQANVRVVHAIPDTLSFEEAATMPCVFMTCIRSLFHLADMQRGNTVLIHSAAGGVGLAAIQLCRYVGAEVYATVGTQEKRAFLKETYDIPDSHIFSSRTTAFASGILKQTDGKGVNIVLNSLSGELLQESWRIIAKGGTMVEIGKRDIVDRSALPMEPFNRNASFRALDLSHDEISDDIVARLLSEAFRLAAGGHIHPIQPMQSFRFTDVSNALRCIREGKHIGKLVISRVHETNIQVPVRPLRRAVCLRSDVCYFIVGGLRGLCSSIAVWLAKNGARRLAVLSRSGCNDDQSRNVARNVRALGCHVDLIQGDVTSKDDLRRALEGRLIGGIIQASMVLHDGPFINMSLKDYDAALRCKVDGTWNLHNTSLELGLNLDFFTMLSSVSGICGSKGQSNYAAANTFLDAFASYRHLLGLPASSVDLGVVSDVGYISERDELKSRYDENIWHPIDEYLLRTIVGYSMQQQAGTPINPASASQMITGLRVPQPRHSPLAHDARFSGLLSLHNDSKTGNQDAHGSLGGMSAAKDFEEIQALIRFKAGPRKVLEVANQTLNERMMKILRLTEPLDFARPISTYGIDSLAAVEVRNLLRVELGVDLTTLEIVNTPSLTWLSERVIEHLSEAILN